MPSRNPKHKKRRIAKRREEQYTKKTKNFKNKRAVSITLFILVLMVISVLIGVLNNRNQDETEDVVFEEGDYIHLEYKLWVADESGENGIVNNNEELYQSDTIKKNITQEDNYIEGFYQAILGMKQGQTKYVEIPYNEHDLGGELENKKLLFWIHVIEIDKNIDETEE